MFLVSTRNFPPELGGMQNLMEGLSNALLNHGPVKVFADNHDDAKIYYQNSKLSIERVSGFKIFRKYRKANLVKDFIEGNEIRACFFDHWKSIENIDLQINNWDATVSVLIVNDASKEIVRIQKVKNGYVRPVTWRGSEMMAISAQKTKIHLKMKI